MRFRGTIASAVCFLLTTSLLLCFVACDESAETSETSEITEEQSQESQTELTYDDVDVNEYVSKVTYKGLTLTLDEEDSKEDALWTAIIESAELKKYPEDKVEYFFNQTKAAYMYLVDNSEEDYLLLLKNRDTNEEEMREEARKMVKKDLVYHYVVRAEGISVSEEEREQLFNKYVEKYVSDYGYSKDYVLSNMTELIYESMLYDKTMEFLLVNNEIAVVPSEETK